MRGIFAVHDRRAMIYGRCFEAVSPVNAWREFAAACTPESLLFQYPEEFELHQVGQFNEETGELTAIAPVAVVATAVEIVRRRAVEEVTRGAS